MSANEGEGGARAPRSWFGRFGDLGTTTQASIPGAYAWAATVAPVAWSRGAPLAAKLVALLGVVLLGGAALTEERWPQIARAVSVWGLVLTSAVVWVAVPAALGPTHLDATRGLAGMLGWALFALASAAPALRRLPRDPGASGAAGTLRPRVAIPRGDLAFILAGVGLALGLQAVGWRVVLPERALLVRLVSLGTGLAVIAAATSIALARHGRRAPASRGRRTRRALPWIVVLGILALAGALVLMRS